MKHQTPSPAGCCIFGGSRWLVQSEDGWEDYVQQLPHELGVAFYMHCDLGRAALDLDDWGLAISEYEICRRMLRSRYLAVENHSGREGEEKFCDPKVQKQTHDWLLAWVNLPLALLYQYRAKKVGEAYYIWEEILECVKPLKASEMRLVTVVESSVSASLYEWACSDNPPKDSRLAKINAIKSLARLNSWDELEAEAHLCLLLCFDHNCFGSWQVALQWTQTAKRLWEHNLPERKEYDHIFLRYEAALLTKLLMFRKAEALLANWLETRDLERSPWHTDRVYHLLCECYTDWSWWAVEDGSEPEQSAERSRSIETNGMMDSDIVAKENLPFEEPQYNVLGLKFEDSHGNSRLSEEWRQRLNLPSGFCFSSDVSRGLTKLSGKISQDQATLAYPTTSEQGHITESLVQKMNESNVEELVSESSMRPISIPLESGLDHHLQKLPLELGVAFCIHVDCGRAALEECDWEGAIVQYQMCRQMLKLTKISVEIETHDWLLAWIDLPLARLYQYRAKEFNKAFQMRREMLDCVRRPNSDWRLENRNTRGKLFSSQVLNYPGFPEKYTYVDGRIHKVLPYENMKQMLDWNLEPSLGDCEGESAPVLGSSDSECDKAYFLRRRRSNRIDRVQWEEYFSVAMDCTPGPSDWIGLEYIETFFERFCWVALYEWACAEYPGMKDEIVKRYTEVGGRGILPDEKESEMDICLFLYYEHSYIGSIEVSLHWIQEAKRSLLHLKTVWSWEKPYLEIILSYEYHALMKLSRLDEANQALKEWKGTNLLEDWKRRGPTSLNPIYSQAEWNAVMSKKAAAIGEPERALDFLKTAERELDEGMFQNMSVVIGVNHDVTPLASGDDCIQKIKTALKDYTVDKFHSMSDQPSDEALSEETISQDLILQFIHYLEKFNQTIGFTGQSIFETDENIAGVMQMYEKFQNHLGIELCPLQQARTNHAFAKIYEVYQIQCLYYLFRQVALMWPDPLIRQNALKVMEKYTGIAHPQHAGPSTPGAEEVQSLSFDIESFFERTRPMVEYCRKALLQYADLLYQMTDHQSAESWISILDAHKDVYHLLEKHYYNKCCIDMVFHKLTGTDPELTREDRDKSKTSAFLWAERQRARVMLYQVGRHESQCRLAARELRAFDTDDDLALAALDMEGTALEKGTVFVEYSCQSKLNNECFIYVRNQDGELSIHRLYDFEIDEFQKRLKNLLTYLNPRENKKDSSEHEKLLYGDDDMHEDLEFFYDHLIKPIAEHLNLMKPEDKLIFAPNELLNKVPFAALRDSSKPSGRGYLIQSHTISLTPSLRVLKKCHDRLQDLHKLPLYPGPGSVVALGDPAYGKFRIRNLERLESTADEVHMIEALFGEAWVVKLLGTHATAESVLQWARKPSCDGKQSLKFRQALFHIGAHGNAQWNIHSKGVLHLARANSRPYPPDAKFTVTSRDIISRDFSKFAEKEDCDTDEDFPQTNAGVESSTVETGDASEIFRSTSTQVTTNLRKSGELNADEISGCSFQWATEMVILSACNTAIGEISAEGVLSLARAFMIAGAPCIVASQWKVMDGSTSVLMKGFYQNLKGGKDVASALRASMLAMIEQDEHVMEYNVHHWAPFIVWGLPTVCLPETLQADSTVSGNFRRFSPLVKGGLIPLPTLVTKQPRVRRQAP